MKILTESNDRIHDVKQTKKEQRCCRIMTSFGEQKKGTKPVYITELRFCRVYIKREFKKKYTHQRCHRFMALLGEQKNELNPKTSQN